MKQAQNARPTGSPGRLAQQQRARIRGDRAAVETGHHLAAFNRCKFEHVGLHSVGIGASCGFEKNRGYNTIFSESKPQCT